MTINLKVGKSYRTSSNDKVHIVGISPIPSTVANNFIGELEKTRKLGRWYANGDFVGFHIHPNRIIQEWVDAAAVEVWFYLVRVPGGSLLISPKYAGITDGEEIIGCKLLTIEENEGMRKARLFTHEYSLDEDFLGASCIAEVTIPECFGPGDAIDIMEEISEEGKFIIERITDSSYVYGRIEKEGS